MWWAIRGLSLCSKKNSVFPNPFTGSRPEYTKKKHPRKWMFSLVDDQGLEAVAYSQNRAKISKKHAKSARFEHRAPKMPQYAPKKKTKIVLFYGYPSLYTSVVNCFELLESKKGE